MCGQNGRTAGHDQERTPGKLLDVAGQAENEAGNEIDDAPGILVVHVLQVDDYRNVLAKVITHGGGIAKVPRAHYRDLDTATHGKPAIRVFIVALNLNRVIIALDETEPITVVASHHAALRQYERVQGSPLRRGHG